MNKYTTYFGQVVTSDDLNAIFQSLATAIEQFILDFGYSGIAIGGDVTQNSTPNLTVLVSGPAVIYDQFGHRISFGPPQVVNITGDENSQPTAVTIGGNEKWVSVFVKHKLLESDPRVDELGNTVYFVHTDSYEFKVAQGPEASLGTASRPPLRGDQILLADIKLISGQTTVTNADVSSTRSEVVYNIEGSPLSVRAKSWVDVLQAMVNTINNINGNTLMAPTVVGSPLSINPNTSLNTALTMLLNAINEMTGDLGDLPDLSDIANKSATQEFTGTNTFHQTVFKEPIVMDVVNPLSFLRDSPSGPVGGRTHKAVDNLRWGSSAAGGQYIRTYVGNLNHSFIIACNATYNFTTNLWERRDTALPATALLWSYGRIRVASTGPGSDTWADWPTDVPAGVTGLGRGLQVLEDLVVGAGIYAGGVIASTGAITSGGAITGASLVSHGNVTADGDVSGDKLIAGDSGVVVHHGNVEVEDGDVQVRGNLRVKGSISGFEDAIDSLTVGGDVETTTGYIYLRDDRRVRYRNGIGIAVVKSLPIGNAISENGTSLYKDGKWQRVGLDPDTITLSLDLGGGAQLASIAVIHKAPVTTNEFVVERRTWSYAGTIASEPAWLFIGGSTPGADASIHTITMNCSNVPIDNLTYEYRLRMSIGVGANEIYTARAGLLIPGPRDD